MISEKAIVLERSIDTRLERNVGAMISFHKIKHFTENCFLRI